MIDMTLIQRALESGRKELVASNKAILPLAARSRIWAAMLDPEDDEASYRRRTQLKEICVRRVAHLWDRAYPGDTRVEEMLSLTSNLVTRTADPKQAELHADRFLADMFDATDDFNETTRPAMLVAYGAARMVISACYRNPDFDIDEAEDDDELLPDTLETSYCCASAAANAVNWQPVEETDVEARREFWTWYLDEAIPQVLAE
ncbi:Imm5 family immunity protein [Actinomyces ruminicola]|uniref:Immunity protein Imm5 n=1 Tax=Actinomyces ruminicola TaxID=332524 RepID=A0A1G9UZP1_9ACTO|nr:Imm5 family immunity protein [Actinomyces ruminicola]SDM65333.1 Immunity protein Imm5 [Actinomyces ruminicola]